MERISVVGIGKIGLCLSLNLERSGYEVLGIDQDREYVKRICERSFRATEPGVEEALSQSRRFSACHQLATLRDFAPSTIFIAANTATADEGGYDHSQIDRILADLYLLGTPALRTEVAIVCTTLPGYCDSQAEKAWEHGYALSYTPGFVAQGSILRDQQFPDQILIGEADAAAGDKLERVLGSICLNQPSVHRMSRLSAEIAKLATNCALTMKIAFANAIGDLATSVNAEPEKILNAIGADTRIGSQYLRYGFGFGGPCFPRDNRALNFFASKRGCGLLQAQVTDESNRRHLEFQVARYLHSFSADEPIHLYSVTYKPGTQILDESQPLELAVRLAEAGRHVVIHESAAVIEHLSRQFGDLFRYQAQDR